MRVCGCEISASEVRLAVVQHDDESGVEMLRLETTRVELDDDTSEVDLRSVLADLQEFAREHEIDVFVIKTRAKKDLDEYPEKLPVYLKNAFLAGAYALTKSGFLA